MQNEKTAVTLYSQRKENMNLTLTKAVNDLVRSPLFFCGIFIQKQVIEEYQSCNTNLILFYKITLSSANTNNKLGV